MGAAQVQSDTALCLPDMGTTHHPSTHTYNTLRERAKAEGALEEALSKVRG
jgi:hypothetical protein